MVVANLVFILSIIQIAIYAEGIPTTIEAERAAHFCEFTTEIFNGLFAFIYAVAVYSDVKRCVCEHYADMKKTI